MTGSEITIRALKYDGSLRRHWKAAIVSRYVDSLIAVGRFEFEVIHDDLGLIKEGTVSFEHFWFDRWYNIFRFHEPDGSLRNYYCNVAMPFKLEGEILEFVDLDIDVVVWPDGRIVVLDRDDFEQNSLMFAYSDAVIQKAEAALVELLDLAERQNLP